MCSNNFIWHTISVIWLYICALIHINLIFLTSIKQNWDSFMLRLSKKWWLIQLPELPSVWDSAVLVKTISVWTDVVWTFKKDDSYFSLIFSYFLSFLLDRSISISSKIKIQKLFLLVKLLLLPLLTFITFT